ncbi:MAG: hypothetical protein FWE85_06425, partial [Clostridiales bacterium]|nr:hypothetical protein [Clostridiales bacterium]
MDHHERQIKERLENMQREPRAQLRGKIICSGAGTSRRRYRKPGGMRLGLKTLLSAMTIVILISATVFAAANAGVLADFFSGISIAKVQPCEDCGKSPCACPDKPSVNLWENDRLYPGLTPACQICGEDEEGCACPDTPPSYACETCGEETCDCVKSPGYAWAGKGTEDDPLQVTTAEQLAEIARLVNAGRLEAQILGDKDATVYIKLMNDISLSAYGEDYNGGNGWIPIGRYVNPKITGYGFNSVFDGDGKTISGLYINDPTAPDWSSVGLSIVGLFGYISGGAVKNLNIADADINAFACIGGVAGHLASGSITNCTVTGNITG